MNLALLFIHTLDARACAPASIRCKPFLGLLGGKSSAEKAQELANEQAERTNQMNLQIHREDIAAQRELQQSQNDWNREQWLEENRYNSPTEQVKRLREAGLNPALVDSLSPGNSTGAPSGSTPSVPSGGQAQQPQIIPPQYRSGMDEILSYLTQAAEIWEKRASIAQMQVATDVAKQKLPYELLNMDANTGLMQQQTTSSSTMLPYQIEAQMAESLKNRQQAALTYYQTQTEKMRPSEISAGLGKTAGETRLLDAQVGALNKKTGAEVVGILAAARNAIETANFTKFKHDFAKEHGFPLENSDWLNRLIMSGMENPKQATEYIDNIMQSIEDGAAHARDRINKPFGELIKGNKSLFGLITQNDSVPRDSIQVLTGTPPIPYSALWPRIPGLLGKLQKYINPLLF